MRKPALLGITILGAFFAVGLLAVFVLPKPGLFRTSFAKLKVTVFENAGFQMEIPTETPFVSSSPAGALIMVHEMSRGFRAESGYLIKLQVRRKSQADMADNAAFATRLGTDEIQQWRYRIHPRLEVKRTTNLWYVRKDLEASPGEFLSIDAELTVTEFIETDLSETERMIESIEPIRN